MKKIHNFIKIASIACVIACIGDFIVTIILGLFYPDYNHLKLVMSELGTSKSPVAIWINLWWIVFGILFITFAIGFKKAFALNKRSVVIVTLLIALFGLGAGICAGLFPMDPGGLETTITGKLHGICGGMGFLAIVFVPLFLLNIFSRKHLPKLYLLSITVFVMGLAFFVLFVISEDVSSTKGLLSYAGLWQRLFLLNYYIYFMAIAVRMLKINKFRLYGTSPNNG